MKKEPRLENYIEVLLRRKWIIILTVSTIFITTIVLNFLKTPIYEASTTLHLKEREAASGATDIFGGISSFVTQTEINTQIEILKSRTIKEEVIRRLQLAENPGDDISRVAEGLKGGIAVELIRDTRLIKITASSPDPVLAKDIVFTFTDVAIEKDISSRRLETTAALDFISQQVEKMGEELQQTEEQLRGFKEKEGFIQLSTEAQLKVTDLANMESFYKSTRISRQEIEVRLAEVKKRLTNIDKTWMVTVSNNPIVQMLRTHLTELQIELAQLSRQFSETAPELIQVKAKIEEFENQLRNEVEIIVSGKNESINPVYGDLYSQVANYETDINALKAKEDALKKLVEDCQKEVDKLPQQELELARLERKSQVNEQLYTLLLTRKSEVRIQSASEIGSLEVVDPPIVPERPVKPRKKLNGILALISGIICGTGLAFFTEYLDKTIKTEDEIKDLLGLPTLGIVPMLGSGRSRYDYPYHSYGRRRKKKKKEEKDTSQVKTKIKTKVKKKEQEKVETISLTKPKSAISEALRILRTNLQFVDLEKKLKTLVVTSSIPGEGKTTVAINLAVTFALAGEKTLLVDADFRKPAIHKVFDLRRDPGITNILTGREAYQTTVKNVKKLDKLNILTTGPLPPNPSELLGSARMKELILKLEEDYDKVIFDSPPSVSLTDASVLSTSAEGTLLVLGAGEVEKEAVQRAKDNLEKVKANILGVVLNKLVLEKRGYGSYYYYYSQEEEE